MTNPPRYRTLDANEAVADVAYRLSEVIAIYPITPASVMGEHADAWSADRRANLWGTVPEVVEMQSEGGAAGAVHGALQAGALTTTFTASQGLLLMLPDLFKIAGELTCFCMHVAARTVATHALSIFGDHSDVMAARSTGMALLASGSERVVALMGSGAECAHETVEHLAQQGERVGVLKVRLFRSFSVAHLLAVLPTSARIVTVLDRTKEPGSSCEPLLQELTSALVEALAQGSRASLPQLCGGRYGLASKDFTPAMVKAVFDNMTGDSPERRFTVGIRDDVSGSSLSVDPSFDIEPDDVSRALFFGLGADGTVSANKASIRIIGEETPLFAQGHFEYDSRKAGSTTISHLRFGPRPIRSTYRISRAQFIAMHDPEFLERRDVLSAAMPGATVLLNTSLAPQQVWESLPREVQERLVERRCRLFVVDGYGVSEQAGLGRRINTVMQICFFALSKVLPLEEAMRHVRRSIEETWGRRGPEVVKRTVAALDATLAALHELDVPTTLSSERRRAAAVPVHAPDFVQRVTRLLLEGRGDDLPVSAFPPDGTWPSGTSQFEKRALALEIPIWQPDVCVQCNFCSMICPHAAIQTKVFDPVQLAKAPAGFRSVPEAFEPALDGLHYAVQVAPEDCTGCGLCIEVCPAKDRLKPRRKALVSEPLADHRDAEREAFAFFQTLEFAALTALPIDKRTAAFRLPLFEFSGACAGCGETPYLRLLTQLFGDHLLIANATGCSSIYGGNLPTTPYTKNRDGRGPAWSNSLFEDNAEFGLGMRLAVDVRAERARTALQPMAARLPATLIEALLASGTGESWLDAQRKRVAELDTLLIGDGSPEAQLLREVAGALVPRSVWIVGGDGWAYDIGYGGFDHVLASQKKVNVLVLDTEVYSNTGGQQSKATPLGAAAKFATAGKATRKKDLGLLAMSYGHVYVAEIAMQARSAQTVEAFLEAECHPGPSLIIAHSPCIAHGYDLVHAPTQQRRAIDSGMWPLYRFDPSRIERGEAPLVLDSGRETLDVAAYMESEARFRMVELRSPGRYAMLVNAAREAVRQRRALYEQLAQVHLPPEKTHG